MPHGPWRSQPGRNVAAYDAVNGAINGRPHKEPVRFPLPEWRKDAEFVQHNVSAVGEYYNGQKSRDYRPYTPPQPPRRRSTTFDWSCCQIRHFLAPLF